jgi:tetratricopeptide (TPR) repeat protein
MVPAMKQCLIAAWMAGFALPAHAAPEKAVPVPALEPDAPAGEGAKEKVPEVEEAIPAAVKALGEPPPSSFPGGIRMAVSAATEKAQDHVLQGLNHLHGGWEFEASRHFASAMREDPECLLAHWGMVMSLLNPSPETGPARNAATDRLLRLVDAGQGTELERGYAYGLMKYIEEGPAGAAAAFRKVADRFPNEMQAAVFSALFNRGGYDPSGDPTPDQLKAEKDLMTLVKRHPESPVPLNALLLIRAESPDLTVSLDLARQLCQMTPDYAPSFHLLGHYEWRCGHHGSAASAFGRASSFFQKWMKENKAGIADCPEWARAECYRIVSMVSKGDFDTAYAAARQVAATPVPKDRPGSPGARFLLWDVKTLPARILVHRGLRGNADEAAVSLPKPEEMAGFRQHSLAYWWVDGLRFALEAQRLIDAHEFEEARNVVNALTQHGQNMTSTQSAAVAGGERSQWIRGFRALEVLASDIRGRLAMAGPRDQRETAYNWFASAADRQHPSPLLLPPMILTPMASRLGEFQLSRERPAEAIDAFQRALVAFPNDMNSLVGLQKAFQAEGKVRDAEVIGKRIADLKEE